MSRRFIFVFTRDGVLTYEEMFCPLFFYRPLECVRAVRSRMEGPRAIRSCRKKRSPPFTCFGDVLSFSGRARTRPSPNSSSPTWLCKWLSMVSSRKKHSSPLTCFDDVLSFSGHAHTRPSPNSSSPTWPDEDMAPRWKYRFILLEWGWYFEKH